MSITLSEYITGETGYVGKMNADARLLETTINALQLQISGAAAGSFRLPTGFEALYGPATAIIGADSYKCQGAAAVLTVDPGFAWIQSAKIVVGLDAAQAIPFTGLPAATYYVAVDSVGMPYRTDASADALYSVVWNGSAFGAITRTAGLAWGFDDVDRAKTSSILGTSYDRLDDRLEAIESTNAAVVTKATADADVTLTTSEATESGVVKLTGTLTADRDLNVPALSKVYRVHNACSGAFSETVQVDGGGGLGVELESGELALIYCDGADCVRIAGQGAGAAGTLLGLSDTPGTYSGASGKVLVVNVGETGLEFSAAASPAALLGLTDTPGSYSGQSGKILAVNVGETALEFVTASAPSFLGLSDSPSDFTDDGGKRVRVNVGETALEFVADDLLGLTDFPSSYAGAANKVLAVNVGETALVFADTVRPDAFPGLVDVPASYAGQGGKVVQVKTGEDGLEFGAGGGAWIWTELGDTPANYAGQSGKVVQVNVDETGLEFGAAAPASFLGLTDSPGSYSGNGLRAVVVNAAENALQFADEATPNSFLGLEDTDPTTYAGQGGKSVRVKGDETGLEFVVPTAADEHAKVSANDTTAGYLLSKLVAGDEIAIEEVDDGGNETLRIKASSIPYDIGGTFSGSPTSGQVVLRWPALRAFTLPAGLTLSQGVVGTAATAQTDFDLKKDGVSFGTMRFAASPATTATFIAAAPTVFAAGNVLTVHAPGTPDATLAELGFGLAATR